MEHQPTAAGPPQTAHMRCIECGRDWPCGHATGGPVRLPEPPARPFVIRLIVVGLAAVAVGATAAIIVWPAAWPLVAFSSLAAVYGLVAAAKAAA